MIDELVVPSESEKAMLFWLYYKSEGYEITFENFTPSTASSKKCQQFST